MNPSRLILFAGVFLAAGSALPAASDFEGIVEYKLTAGKSSSVMRYTIKGDRMLLELDHGKKDSVSAVYDGSSSQISLLMPEQKMYMALGKAVEEVADAMETEAQLEETDQTEEILGYTCRLYRMKEAGRKGNTYEIWGTKGLGRFLLASDFRGRDKKRTAWADLLARDEIFPLRVVTSNNKGKVTSTMEATRVEKQDVDDAAVSIPEGYTEFKIPGLGGALRGLMGQ